MHSSQHLTIATTGDNILTLKAAPVTVFDDELAVLASNMLLTMQKANGVGIAATQVFSNTAMFIMASNPNERYPDAPIMEPTVVINPKILSVSTETENGIEGCLSVPGKRLNIVRHRQIEVQYQSLNGQIHHQVLQGFVARIFQHEYDHLQGITLLERINLMTPPIEVLPC
ncbi:peptide deformylase [Shewanella inventionis]|uniref:Peptide deformylase n=1 Tax=Shewanella inventionis TaxID=1738770 RepID=A0ABQ1J301_9GAMM|nr:peptide deformylase [Shewanella inventionis]MCL1158438.1 peptide deformylase [Shewanella inventionis]UAL43021.1 peptide deformylase [Shewanella inventionis]GGB56797.1 peptide deformylase 2 [Shewanella inventionis]